MGNAAQTVPRTVLQTDVQLHFKAGSARGNVGSLVTEWLGEGSPLGMSPEMFELALGLQPEVVAPFFGVFDTDGNGKVDALEVFSIALALAHGSIDDKLETMIPIFDFSCGGRLNFDEVSILVHSVYRGVHKVCKTPRISDEELMDVARRVFDAHNVPYEDTITKEQIKRWLRSDVDAAAFVDVFQLAFSLADVEVKLAQQEQAQAKIFTQLCTSSTSLPSETLATSSALRSSLGTVSDADYEGFLNSMSGGKLGFSVSLERFLEGMRAFNAFEALDVAREGSLHTKEMRILLWLSSRQEPPDAAVQKLQESLRERGAGERVSRALWLEVILEA